MTVRDTLFVTIDSLRADRVRFLGYDRETTPILDQLATNSVVYENATAHGPTTFTSFPSMLTGEHAYENPGFPSLAGTTIAEKFLEAGYHTFSITSNAWTSPTYNYDRGFNEVHNLGRGPRSADSRWDRLRHQIGDILGQGRAFKMIKGTYDRLREVKSDDKTEEDIIHDTVVDHLARDEPTFTWVHYMTAHTPYTVDPDYPVPYADTIPNTDRQREIIEQARESPEVISENERTLLSNLYDASICHVDRRIGELIDGVDINNTVVCITADHGEAFWEHGYFEHPPKLHQELLEVPLLIWTPDTTGRYVEEPVGLSALSNTLERLAGVTDADGKALPPWGKWASPVCSAVAHRSQWEPEQAAREALSVSVRDGDWKFIEEPDGNQMLFDLSSDSRETEDVATANPSIVERLSSQAESFTDDFTFGEVAEVPDELKDRLSDLGYVK